MLGDVVLPPQLQGGPPIAPLKPAAARAGLGKIGWHTFRHTYSTMLRSAGTDIKVQSELLRHANIATTMDVYTQAVSEPSARRTGKLSRWCWPEAGFFQGQIWATCGGQMFTFRDW